MAARRYCRRVANSLRDILGNTIVQTPPMTKIPALTARSPTGGTCMQHLAAAARSTRTGHAVSDLDRFLLGCWQLRRLGWDGVPGRTMRFHGTASFSACDGGLLFEERGVAAFGTYLGEAVRRYIFRLGNPGRAAVCFEDGTLFHCLDLTKGVALVRHDCAADRYEGRYHVLGPDCWVLSWRVTGPRKRQLITSRFTRAADAD